MNVCSVEGCGTVVFCRGWCKAHYYRWYRHGDVDAARPVGRQDGDRRQRFRENLADPRHGSENGYKNLKCRCDDCTRAWAVAHLEWMHAHPEQLERHRLAQMRRRRLKRVADEIAKART